MVIVPPEIVVEAPLNMEKLPLPALIFKLPFCIVKDDVLANVTGAVVVTVPFVIVIVFVNVVDEDKLSVPPLTVIGA